MGSFAAVAQGERARAEADRDAARAPGASGDVTLGLVGKAVTFDTGGISLKPALSMDGMKGDMAGGAAVIAATAAIAELGLPLNVVVDRGRRPRTCPAATRFVPATSSAR